MRPGPGVVISSLRLLVRISRHSLDAARQIVYCPGLIQTVLVEFLPPFLPHTFSTSTLYGAPVWLACKLCRTLSAWDVNLARFLTTEFHFEQSLMAYLTVDPSEAAIPARESVLVCIESYRTWCLLLRYNLATESFTNLYPVLMRQLLYFVEKIDISPGAEKEQFNLDVGCWLISVLTTVLGCTDRDTLSWIHVADLRKPVETCCRKWLVQLSRLSDPVSTSGSNLVATALTFLSVYYVKLKTRTTFDPEQFKSELRTDFKTIVQNLLDSEYFKLVCAQISKFSGFLSGALEQRRSFPGLPVSGAVLRDGAVHPVLEQTSPMFFISAVFRFISIIQSFDPEIVPGETVLQNLNQYFQKLTNKKAICPYNFK